MPNHPAIDERSHEMHQVIVGVLRRDPSSLTRVVDWMRARLVDPEYSESLKDCLREWSSIIDEGFGRVVEVLEDRGEEGDRLRQNSPFAILMPQEERARILKWYQQHEPIGAGAHSSRL